MNDKSNAEEIADSFSQPCYNNFKACAIDRANCSCGYCEHYRALRNAIEDAEEAAVNNALSFSEM